jgi:hypothetical protein
LIHWFAQPVTPSELPRGSLSRPSQGLDSPFRSCRARIATHSAIRNAAASTPKNGPKFTTPCPIIPVEIVAATPGFTLGARLEFHPFEDLQEIDREEFESPLADP